MEVMTTIVVISILCLMAYQSFTVIQAKAERSRCESNLRSLYTAAASYVTDQGSWPQIPVDDLDDPAFALAWIDAFTPYKIGRVNWICPSVQKALGNPSYEGNNDVRIDYIPTPFEEGPHTPYQWPTHPWFLERGDVHGDGNLIMFTNGRIRSLTEVKKDSKTIQLP